MFADKLRIKLYFKCESKLEEFPSSFEELCMISKKFFDFSEEEMKNLQYSYIDEDGDKVNISNSFDLEQARLFAEKENLNFMKLEVLNIFEANDIINETTMSIKCYDEKDFIFRDIDMKLNNLYMKEKSKNRGQRELIEIFSTKLMRAKREFVKNILSIADNIKKESKRIKTQLDGINILNQNKTINNKNIYERINNNDNLMQDNKTDKILIDENELKEIVKKVIEEEFEAIKSKIIEKSIKRSIEMVILKRHNKENKNVDEEMHKNIECQGCSKNPIKGLRFKCGICDVFNLCHNCESKIGQEHKHPLIKLRSSESYSNQALIDLRLKDKKRPSILGIQKKLPDKKLSNKSSVKNNIKCIQENFDLSNVNPKFITEIIPITKGNLDNALNYIFNK